MPFEAGTRLGPYEIVAPLGAGGMGEVYRARDTRLDRPVAIKILVGSLAADSESRQRFEQEARAIAALHDPHILTIHDIGRHGDRDYLVLEYLEGETLADRLERTPTLPIDEALAIAIQIGDALDHAHRAGVVHRDLKPGNVMLARRVGAASAVDVKLLDFGLAARTHVARAPIIDASLTETLAPSQEATRLGAGPATSGFSGTVQYMAPEQIAGDSGDHRTDIFAFGCVLYEMLAGRKAFDGASAMAVIAAITNSEPPPIAAVHTAHPLLDHVIRRCLEKDRERRWQSIGDVTGELRWIAEQPNSPTVAATAARSNRVSRALLALAIVLGIISIVAGSLALQGRRPSPNAPALRFEIATAPTDDSSVALSADGTQLAFIANQDRNPVLWVRSLDALENRAVPGTEGASLPFWSPDGRTIGFFADGKLKRVDVAGGTPLVITDAPNARGGAWNRDGVILFASGVSAPIRRVSTRGGPVETVTEVNGRSGPDHRWPQFLPDGKRFLFSSTLGTAETNGVYLTSLEKITPVRVVVSDGPGRFAAPNAMLTVIRQGALQAYAFDPASGTVQGEPVVLAQGFAGAGATGGFGTSETGVLAYRPGAAQRRQLTWVDRKGNTVRAIGEPSTDFVAGPELSADEQSVAVFLQRSSDNDIWVIELARNLARRITDGPPADAHPLWDPDGEHIAFYSRRIGRLGGPTRQALVGGTAEPLFPNEEGGLPLSWTRDRQFLLVRRLNPKTGSDLVAIATAGPPREVIVSQSAAEESEGQFSPDGKWVAFVANDSGRQEVFLQAFPSGKFRTQVSTAGGAQVRWSNAGNEVFYIAPDGKMTSVSVTLTDATPQVKEPTALFQTHLATGTNVLGNKPQYAVSRDGRFLLNAAVESANTPIVVSVNWMKALTK